jgi:hypothetical protein
MREDLQIPLPDMHSEAWWMRLMDDDLSPREEQLWQAHLEACESCRREWAAWIQADALMRVVPTPPPVPEGFTTRTVQQIVQKQRLRRLLTFLAGALIVAAVSLIVFSFVGSADASLERGLGAVISARQVLFRSLVQTLVSLLLRWKTLLPFVVGTMLCAYVLAMPNGLIVTMGLVWLSRRRQLVTAAVQ